MSKFPITVDEVGLKRRGRKDRIALPRPIIPDGGPWPRKLEPRQSVTALFDPTEIMALRAIGSIHKAYATTACGTTCYGESGALKDFIRLLAKT